MLHLGIDEHKSQLTVNLRGEDGLLLGVETGAQPVSASASYTFVLRDAD
jgi:hypothetical protein